MITSTNPIFYVPSSGKWLLRRLVVGSAVLTLAACAVDPVPTGTRFSVKTPSAEFFINGPAQVPAFTIERFNNQALQGPQPDFQLSRGSAVTMIRREMGYSKVKTDDGTIGYVANEQLQPAPALTLERRPEYPVIRSKEPRRRPPVRPRSEEERLKLDDLELPLPG